MIIRSDTELKESQARRTKLEEHIRRIRAELAGKLDESNISVAISPQQAMLEELEWDIGFYTRLKRGDLDAIPNYPPEDRGKVLVCLRLAKGWSQRELANALGVSEAVVSRDERNEYQGVSLEKYGKVLSTLGYQDNPRFEPVGHTQQREAIMIDQPMFLKIAASYTPEEKLIISEEAKHA